MEDRLFEWGASIIAALLGLLWNDQRGKVKEIENRIKDHEQVFAAYRENSAGKYTTKDDLKELEERLFKFIARVEDRLVKIENKLDKIMEK